MRPFTRLQCACKFSESCERTSKLLDKAEDKGVKISELKEILHSLQEDYKEHVEKHNIQYAHSLVEFHRSTSGPLGGGGPVLKTSMFAAGDVKRARNPVKVEGKKNKRKKKKQQQEENL